MHGLRFPPWKESPFTRRRLVRPCTKDVDVCRFQWDPFLSRPNLVEWSSGVLKDVVPCEMVVARVKPKSGRVAWSGVESAMRMLGWEHGYCTIGSFVRVEGLTALVSPYVTLRYLTPLTTPTSYAAMRGEVNECWCWWNI